MLIELKRCNNIGNIEGLLFLAKVLFSKPFVNKQEIANRASLEKNIVLNSGGAVAFFQYLNYVSVEGDNVIPTEKMNALAEFQQDQFVKQIVKDCISILTEEGIFDAGSMNFDVESGHLHIRRTAFPLAYAAVRNFLTNAGALDKEINGEIGISESYESDFSDILRSRQEKFTLAQLIERQKKQSERGLAAEEFVLSLEKKRVPGKADKIKRISDFDVSAGYDIVSFSDVAATHFDRFVEVKCYLGDPHFYWSENEVDVAKIKGEKYYLCLVDYEKMVNEPDYKPEIIQNPYEVIFSEDSWLVNTASYKVQKI